MDKEFIKHALNFDWEKKFLALESMGLIEWIPMVGDIYTIYRHDLELFKIYKINYLGHHIKMIGDDGKIQDLGPTKNFTDGDFHKRRIPIPNKILNLETYSTEKFI